MKLKDSTFAIIAEKKDSISHKWFNQLLRPSLQFTWLAKYYICKNGVGNGQLHRPRKIPIYTESEFEALLKAEQENERYKETMDRVIAPQVLEMAKFKEENPNATEEEIETKRNELTKKYATIQTFGGMTSTGENAQTFPKKTVFGKENIAHKHPPLTETLSELERKLDLALSKETKQSLEEWLKTDHNPPEPQVTFTYQAAIDLLAYYTKIDKGIIKIEMP